MSQTPFRRCHRRVSHPEHEASWRDGTKTQCDGQPERRLLAYDLPITPTLLGRLVVPDDLTPQEAERVCNIVRALALPSGDE